MVNNSLWVINHLKNKNMKNLINTNKRKIAIAGLLLFFVTAFSSQLSAQDVSTISFAVKKEGKGKPVIFIPGLDCSGKVWDDAVLHFKKNFECYTITLPGFAGQPAIKTDSILETITKQLALYIKKNKLNKPVIIGHSLGGWLAINFAIKYPNLAGDIICVSSAPFMPALSMGLDIPLDSTRKIGVLIKNGMAGQTPDQVRKGQKLYLPTMIRDTAKINLVVEMAAQSDQKTQGEIMYELFSTDLRLQMGNIKSRILVLGDWSAYKQYGATRESVYNNYKEQFKLAPQVTIALNDDSRHFIMFDEPQWFYSQADSFLFK
jgi:pimeloyl-ACP methyl ester carboxylesterase